MKTRLFGMIIIIVILTAFTGCVTITSNDNLIPIISKTTMALEVDEETFEVIVASDVFKTDTPIIYLVAQVEDAPEGTQVRAEWYYLDEEIFIDDITVEPEYQNQPMLFSLGRPDTGWPIGKYQASLYLNEEKATIVFFTVE